MACLAHSVPHALTSLGAFSDDGDHRSASTSFAEQGLVGSELSSAKFLEAAESQNFAATDLDHQLTQGREVPSVIDDP